MPHFESSRVPYYVRGLALGLPAILFGLQIAGWIFFLPGALHGHADFRHLYTAGWMVRSGYAHHLYDYGVQKQFQDRLVSREQIAMPFNHLAYEALLFVPFSLLSYRGAYLSFLFLNISVLLSICFFVTRRLANLRALWKLLPPSLFIAFLPVEAALMHGQDSVLIMALLAAAVLAMDAGRQLPAGFLVGLGLFKFQLVLPVAILFLLWKQKRFVAGFGIASVLVLALSLFLVGKSQVGAYVSLIDAMTAPSSLLDQLKYGINPTDMPNLRGLLSGLSGGHLSPASIKIITLSIFAGLLLLVAIASPVRRGREGLCIAITAAACTSYHIYIHDLTILVIPVVFALNVFIEFTAGGSFKRSSVFYTSALAWTAPMLMSFSPKYFYVVSLAPIAFLTASLFCCRQRDEAVDRRPLIISSPADTGMR
jgi:hypothetical protein